MPPPITLTEDELLTLHEELRQRGFRLTPQRLAILQSLERSAGHVSAEEIHGDVVAEHP